MTTKNSHGKHADDAADLKEAAKDIAGETGDKLAAALENTKQFVTGVRDRAVATAKATDQAINEQPYKYLAVAAGVGVLLGYIMGRRCSSKAKAEQD